MNWLLKVTQQEATEWRSPSCKYMQLGYFSQTHTFVVSCSIIHLQKFIFKTHTLLTYQSDMLNIFHISFPLGTTTHHCRKLLFKNTTFRYKHEILQSFGHGFYSNKPTVIEKNYTLQYALTPSTHTKGLAAISHHPYFSRTTRLKSQPFHLKFSNCSLL